MEQSLFDAVLFHERNILYSDLPMKDQRRSDQVYIHYNLESPLWTKVNLSGSDYDLYIRELKVLNVLQRLLTHS